MDGGGDGPAPQCQLLQGHQEVEGRGGVEAAGGLIQHQNGGVDEQLLSRQQQAQPATNRETDETTSEVLPRCCHHCCIFAVGTAAAGMTHR
jgi:hypothetical protein